MPHRKDSEFHPVGFSGHKNEYRKGVCQGNYAEELLAADAAGRPFVLDRGAGGAPFQGQSTTAATYTPAGKSGSELAAVAQREDIRLKYVKYGRSAVLPEDKTGFWASTAQLAYEGAGGAAAAAAALTSGGSSGSGGQGPSRSAPKVQDLLWGATKFENRKVPVSAHTYSASEQRRRQLEEEAAASPYRTVEKDSLAAAAQDTAARLAARQPMARPHDPRGADTQTGRKANGEFVALFEKDYLKIGLRKQPKSPPA